MTSTAYSASSAGGNIPLIAGGMLSLATFYSEMQQALFTMRWALLFIIVLIITDFWTGYVDNVKHHAETFRSSRAIRRSFVKFLEYINYIIFGYLLSKSIMEPLGMMDAIGGAALGSMLALVAEANSIYGHICSIHGWVNPPSIRKVLTMLLFRRKEDIIDAVDNKEEEKNNTKS